MRALLSILIVTGAAAASVYAYAQTGEQPPEAYAPGSVSTDRYGEVKLAVRPDGLQEVWGTMHRTERGQFDLWERHRMSDGSWSDPQPMAINSPGEDFDPVFSSDGQRLYLHSNRPGGFGRTDIYVSERIGEFEYAEPENLGPSVNSAGAEWAPWALPDGKLLFASDGWGGEGNHDIFIVDPQNDEKPTNLGRSINGPLSEFDPAVSADGRTFVFSRGLYSSDGEDFAVWRSDKVDDSWTKARPVSLGCGTYTIGLAFLPGGDFSISSRCSDTERGTMDIYVLPREALDQASPSIMEAKTTP